MTPLVRYDSSDGSESDRVGFSDLLLPLTLKNALRAPYYQSALGDVECKGFTSKKLATLPELNRDLLTRHLEDIELHNGQPRELILTGGSSGTPLPFSRTYQEQQFVRRFFRHAESEDEDVQLRRGIRFTNAFQTNGIQVPTQVRYHNISLYDHGSFDLARKLLLDDWHEDHVQPTCSILLGQERPLRAFTLSCLEASFPFSEATIDYVFIYGHYLSDASRRFLELHWNAPLVDRYGLTEVFGGATQDLNDQWYEFDPYCIAEVVNVIDRKPIQTGIGELILTPLYPFQESLPLLRYATGDLVGVKRRKLSDNTSPRIKPLGRKSEAAYLSKDGASIVPAAVFYEVADNWRIISRNRFFEDSPQISDRDCVGRPLYAVDRLGRRRDRLAFRFTLSPSSWDFDQESEARALRQQVVHYAERFCGKAVADTIEVQCEFETLASYPLISHSP